MDPNISTQPTQPVQAEMPAQQPLPPKKNNSKKIFWIFAILFFLVAFTVGGFFIGTKQNVFQNKQKQISPTPLSAEASAKVDDPTANWKTYISTTEKASFKYPQGWIVVKPAIESNFPEADQTALQSPSGKIKVSWVSALDGFGGMCDDKVALGQEGACPLFTLIDKTPINGAQGLYVISGTITTDGSTYKPFLAVQGNEVGGLLSTRRTMGYDMFTGKNNSSLPEITNNTTALFSTSGPYGDGPSLTQAEATVWFNDPEVQQAKLILLSFTYQQ